VIIGISIFVPLTVTIVIAWYFLRGARSDPDEARLKQAQADYERAQRER
jgi:hypothetical protein